MLEEGEEVEAREHRGGEEVGVKLDELGGEVVSSKVKVSQVH
jgi:hypothetical protein